MLSFAPGELSTVVGPRYFGNIAATTLPFNFADLVSEKTEAITPQRGYVTGSADSMSSIALSAL